MAAPALLVAAHGALATLGASAGAQDAAALPGAGPVRCALLPSGEYCCARGAAPPAGCSAAELLVGAPIAAYAEGAWHAAGGTLKPSGEPPRALRGSDSIGAFVGTQLAWTAGESTPFTTSVRNYDAPPCVVFEYTFPEGAERTAHAPANGTQHGDQAYDLLTNFPAFTSVKAKEGVSWADAFINFQPHLAFGPNGGPAVFFDAAGSESPVMLLSPLDHFIGSSSTDILHDGRGAAWAGGIASTVAALPRGFSHSFVLFSGVGITTTMHDWGQLIQRLANTTKVPDPTLTGLSYQTDNGAQYCFCNEKCDTKLIEMRSYLRQIDVPIQLVSFQGGWWTNKNIHTPLCAPWCVSSWVPNASKVPMGLEKFHEGLGLPLQLYAPYFCNDTVYDEENGGKWPFLASDTSLPGCGGYSFKNVAPDKAFEFYSWFLQQGREGGMVAFEPDFLQQNHQCLPAFRSNLSAMPTWLDGLSGAAVAMEPPVPIQFCMATPMELLQATKLPAVTNFRASNDFFYGGSYKLGSSSLLIWAAGSAPSKDTFWTTDNSLTNNSCSFGETSLAPNTCGCPANGCPPDHSNVSAGLHTLLAAMSTGPVGFSDAIGQTNASLIRRTCSQNGTLLQPSKPLTTIDRLLLASEANDAPTVLGSYSGTSVAAPVRAWYVVSFGSWAHGAHQPRPDFSLFSSDLWPPLSATLNASADGARVYSGRVARWAWGGAGPRPHCANGSAVAGCAELLTPAGAGSLLTLHPPAMEAPPAPTLHVFAPQCANGWTLLGELEKFATLSSQRFAVAECTEGGVRFVVHGMEDEAVEVTALSPAGTVLVQVARPGSPVELSSDGDGRPVVSLKADDDPGAAAASYGPPPCTGDERPFSGVGFNASACGFFPCSTFRDCPDPPSGVTARPTCTSSFCVLACGELPGGECAPGARCYDIGGAGVGVCLFPDEPQLDAHESHRTESRLKRGAVQLPLDASKSDDDVAEQGECTSNSDCYGGRCQLSDASGSGVCICPPLWGAPNCQVLRLKPARASAPGLLLPGTSTWGGTAVQGEDGKFNMIAARMEGHCGLHTWHNSIGGVAVANSDVVHATALSPDGPYSLTGTVLGTFAHGPQTTFLPDGRVAVVHLGCGNRTLPQDKTCTNGTTPSNPDDDADALEGTSRLQRPPGLSNCDWPAWAGVLLQDGPTAFSSWKQLADWSGPGLVVATGPNSWHTTGPSKNDSVHADNPSFWPLKNGTVLLAYASKLKAPAGGHKHIGLAVGELPLSGGPLKPFRDISEEPIFPYEAEDPTIWEDTTNNLTEMRWHIMAHRLVSNISTEVCAHAVAASPFGPWKVAPTPAYTKEIEWAAEDTLSATVTAVAEGRERPHVIFDRTGRPVALSTGVTPGRSATPVTPGGSTGDFSYTHVQLFDPMATQIPAPAHAAAKLKADDSPTYIRALKNDGDATTTRRPRTLAAPPGGPYPR